MELLVNVGDIKELVDAMIILLQDPALRLRIGHSGHKFALENYHQDQVARRTFEVYQYIAAQEKTARA